ncbi:hypothetical protein F383_23467 [Gossypium arboreum]|uniref:Uncharacterized protein n=1 Tax=Gossypium arboreum TaxID=29729 RepID=A0A0B0NWM9_GOSAR|nr:hypothetical protein F383_23467 [Gossypium arboreum]
MFWLNLSVII